MNPGPFTDLALEAAPARLAADTGVDSRTERRGELTVTRLRITSPKGEAALGRPMGRYDTVTLPADLLAGEETCEQAVDAVAELLSELLPAEGCLLAAGLGNIGVTPDALGPLTVSRVLVTRHLLEETPALSSLLRPVAAVRPGVLGQTGMESAELLRAVVERLRPAAVVAIDALTCRSLARLGRTIQLTDTGLLPGGGLGGSRQELSSHTLGVPVIGLGVPTLISAAALAAEVLAEGMGNPTMLPPMERYTGFYVASRRAGEEGALLSRLLGEALNRAFQRRVSPADLRFYAGDPL